ncbi:N-acetyltransferase [Duganella sp. BJB488]|uniref:GNAT family N-acetyltransferase n=1 Tax=Duganella vulcania TaxID=2692166 RepID=A0A845HM90_9BURK|nr:MULTISPECIES: GNAT family protein [Duganella]MCU6498489.1 GNAT family N-acetyltransferase [Rugamonas sp. A1-17]MYN18569.1 GNAT family N-acetyltransferase [Duganella vulcania]NVD74690.1 GNAT family N-acetyltransferase [Duganella sp. BJB1802]RFP21600.1 N-acetyltransferase [Duganella sp. BJB489]RFP23393.1 N-acetyltransferase [Duganella sp. BJB488]
MLKGSLCTVRHLLTTDLNTFIALVNDLPSRGDYFSSHFKSPETMRKEFMQNGFVSDDSELFVIEDGLHHIVGVITHFKSRTPVTREIGYRLFDSKLSGHGYVTEACRMLVDYLFKVHQFHRLELLSAPENVASIRVAQKCGFSAEGTLRQSFFINGRYQDVQVFSLLRPEWEALRG